MTRVRRTVVVVALVGSISLGACGGGDSRATETSSEPTGDPTAPAGHAATQPSTNPTGATAAASVAALAGPAVDVCALVTREEAQEITGAEVDDPTASPASGSLLGDCTYFASDFSSGIALSARPASEYQATVDFYRAEVTDVQVAGAAAAVFGPDVGLMMQPEGAAYMLQLTRFTGEGDLLDEDAHTAAAVVILRS